jgi:hypothetical protein
MQVTHCHREKLSAALQYSINKKNNCITFGKDSKKKKKKKKKTF